MAYWGIFVVVLFTSVAMTVREGFWSNTVRLINLLISGLLAFSLYSPLSKWIDEMLGGQYTYAIDFVVLWGLFVVIMLICYILTKLASNTRMRFRHPIDSIAGPLVGFCVAWVLGSFIMATIHVAPFPKGTFGAKYAYESVSDIINNSSLSSPDLGWLRFVQRMSAAGAFGSGSGDNFNAAGWVAANQKHRENLEKADAPWLAVRR